MSLPGCFLSSSCGPYARNKGGKTRAEYRYVISPSTDLVFPAHYVHTTTMERKPFRKKAYYSVGEISFDNPSSGSGESDLIEIDSDPTADGHPIPPPLAQKKLATKKVFLFPLVFKPEEGFLVPSTSILYYTHFPPVGNCRRFLPSLLEPIVPPWRGRSSSS